MSGNEAKTRKEIIDKRLQVTGWNVNDHTQVVEKFDIDVRHRLGVQLIRASKSYESNIASLSQDCEVFVF
jgi:type I site-specific restriction endonuclease